MNQQINPKSILDSFDSKQVYIISIEKKKQNKHKRNNKKNKYSSKCAQHFIFYFSSLNLYHFFPIQKIFALIAQQNVSAQAEAEPFHMPRNLSFILHIFIFFSLWFLFLIFINIFILRIYIYKIMDTFSYQFLVRDLNGSYI